MSNHKNLVFFNKEGDYLNFQYNIFTDRFEGDILFDENSADTYKTFGIYTMEKIPAFEYDKGPSLTLEKFQLFNEWGFHFYGGPTQSYPVLLVDPVNNDPTFYSKWINGDDFDSLFPIGSLISFVTPYTEFTDPKRTYAVVGNKMNAIMIISDVDNLTFEIDYQTVFTDDTTYSTEVDGKTVYSVFIKAVNAVGVYNYIDSQLQNNLSTWNEPNFYDMIYDKRKLNLVNTDKNDGVVTVINSELKDGVCYEYFLASAPKHKELVIEYVSKGDLPIAYNGPITLYYDAINNRSSVQLNTILPDIMKPGLEFRIVGSNNNNINLRVSDIIRWEVVPIKRDFKYDDLVIFDNRIYTCVYAYTYDTTNLNINPRDKGYWQVSSSVFVDQVVNNESLTSAQLYLTTDRLYFAQAYTHSSTTTFGLAVDKYAAELRSLNVDLYVKKGILKADLVYPSAYAEVNFYAGDTETTEANRLGKTHKTNERIIEVRERLNTEMNYNISENFQYNIVFTDIDNYGIKITINKQVYQEEGVIIYTGSMIDIERSIDKTLRNWLNRYQLTLNLLGVETELYYIGVQGSPFFNSIILKSKYPNVPMIVNKVEVGTTADFHIEHTRVQFNNTDSLGAYLTVTVNGDDYSYDTIYQVTGTFSKVPDIPATLDAWHTEHAEYLASHGLYVTHINNILKFDVKRTDPDFVITVKNGLMLLPGQTDLVITDKSRGSVGSIITSNSVLLLDTLEPTLLGAGFSTGMALSVNNTIYPLMNVEYNAQYVSSSKMNLSYEGPFWGLTTSICSVSPYVTVAFDSGFGLTACLPAEVIGIGSPFEIDAFSYSAFTKYRYRAEYDTNTRSLSTVPGSAGMVDLKYVQLADSIFILATNLIVMDAINFEYTTYVPLPGNSGSIKLEYNEYNNYLYCLSTGILWIIDPVINIVIDSIILPNTAYDVATNPLNGDVYVTYSDSPTISVYDYTGTLTTTITTPEPTDTQTGKIIYNSYAEDMFVTTDGDYVIRINGLDRSIQTSYYVSGLLTDRILYEPVDEAVYVWSSSNLYKIVGGDVTSIPGVTTTAFAESIFNNLTGEINISDNNGIKSLNLETDALTFDEAITEYGYMTLNQYDTSLYISSQYSSSIRVINPNNGWVIYTEPLKSPTTRIIYNQARKSVWAIQPNVMGVIEILSIVDTEVKVERLDGVNIEDSSYGTLSDDYSHKANVWLKTREYFRKPRENFEGDTQVTYYWEWFNDQTPEFFLYDMSGDQLDYTGSFSYTGPRPMGDVPLNKYANKYPERVGMPEFQQTVFDRIYQKLDYIDSTSENDVEPEAMQTFVGFKSVDEGPKSTALQLYKMERINFSIPSTATNDTIITYKTKKYPDGRYVGEIRINNDSQYIFSNRGLKRNQILTIEMKDTTNTQKQYNSFNNGSIFRIRDVYTKLIVVDFFKDSDFLDTEATIKQNWPSQGKMTYLTANFRIIDREIGRFRTMAQTEIEDIRFKTNLNNIGKNIDPEQVYIFKDYDIKEGGVDWKFLNMKRKEMLMNKNLIYTYVGAYKSIINAINFFGYNDLQLNEYYRNIDPDSKDFLKLFKLEIPDIFDNTVTGWNDSDFLKNTMPNENFEETKLFNLTYDITDKDGNALLTYTVEEVTLKLQGLKHWLSKNVIPLTHKIQDITGKSYFKGGVGITHVQTDVKTFRIRENSTPITFKLGEAYLMPVNSGSTVYNCVLDFYSIIPDIGAKKPKDSLGNDLIKAYNGFQLVLPEYYSIKIRTWKTYKEWAPFVTYKKGERVFYYDKIYESAIDNNKLMNPRDYESVAEWSETDAIFNNYDPTNLVKYKRRIYTFSGLGDPENSTNPLLNQGDNGNWLDVTEWLEIDLEPVQTITEYRMVGTTASNPLTPFNFTVDSNLDPYISIEVSTDNGYGGVYTDKKNYEIRGIKDLAQKLVPIERIGPFRPIMYLNNTDVGGAKYN